MTSRIETFNADLVKAGIKLELREYIKQIASAAYGHVFHEFADDLLDLSSRGGDFCIGLDQLIQYGFVLPGSPCDQTIVCERLMTDRELVEGRDYTCQETKTDGDGTTKTFMLTVRAFEVCLMRAEHTDKYTQFYILLPRILMAYTVYQRAFAARTAARSKLDNLLVAAHALVAAWRAVEGTVAALETDQASVKANLGLTETALDEVRAPLGALTSRILMHSALGAGI